MRKIVDFENKKSMLKEHLILIFAVCLNFRCLQI